MSSGYLSTTQVSNMTLTSILQNESHFWHEHEHPRQRVEAVVSAPRLPRWAMKIPGAQILTSANTTHWGLKVGASYHDLKMRGLFQTRPDVAFAETLDDRDERRSSKIGGSASLQI